MKHYTNKNTLEVFGYDTEECARDYNDDYENLVLMSDELFEQYKSKPLGGAWSLSGWVIDHELAQVELYKQKETENTAFVSSENQRVNIAIAPLDDAIEFGVATEDEIHKHTELRKYRLLLSRVANQENWPLDPIWPTCPEFFRSKE